MSSLELASVNGVVGPLRDAVVPVSDHGFLYGDSVYETIRTYGARPFLLGPHLERLRRSADAIHLTLTWGMERVAREISRIIEAGRASGAGPARGDGGSPPEYALRVLVTRGVGPLGYDPSLCPEPGLVLLLRDLPPPAPGVMESGVPVIVSSIRRNPIASLDPRIKSSNLLNNILASHEARDARADEAILFNTAGELAEGTLTNVFFVSGGIARTPSLECGLLSGVTRELVLELAAGLGIPCEEGRYRRADLDAADEIFLTGTTREIMPVATLDGRPVSPRPGRGPVTARLQEAFQRRVEAFLREPGA